MANKERKVKKVQARHILVGSKELADEIKRKSMMVKSFPS